MSLAGHLRLGATPNGVYAGYASELAPTGNEAQTIHVYGGKPVTLDMDGRHFTGTIIMHRGANGELPSLTLTDGVFSVNIESRGTPFNFHVGENTSVVDSRFQNQEFMRLTAEKNSAFSRCSFENAVIRGGNVEGAVFESCSFQGARIFGVDARGVTLENCSINAQTSFLMCDLRDADIRELRGADGHPLHPAAQITAGLAPKLDNGGIAEAIAGFRQIAAFEATPAATPLTLAALGISDGTHVEAHGAAPSFAGVSVADTQRFV
jgi:hypothetical protein